MLKAQTMLTMAATATSHCPKPRAVMGVRVRVCVLDQRRLW